MAAHAVPDVTPPASATTSLAISVSGYITPKCTVDTHGGSGDFGNISNARTGSAEGVSLSLRFTMDCNTPYEAVLVSKNGGLAYQGTAEPSFAATVDYTAALNMSQIPGGVALRCESDAMRGHDDERSNCHGDSASDIALASGDGTIDLKLKGGGLPLQSGTYSDKLILRLSPRV